MKRFTIIEQGPDDYSTYAECWGSPANRKRGKLVADCDNFDDVVEVIHDLGHTNYTIRDRHRHVTFSGPALREMRAHGYQSRS